MKKTSLAIAVSLSLFTAQSNAGLFDKILEDAVNEGINDAIYGKNKQANPSSSMAPPSHPTLKKQPDQTVLNIQSCLNDKGYNAGPADGLIGKKTRNAIKAFEADNGMHVTGAPSQDTMSRVCSGSRMASEKSSPKPTTQSNNNPESEMTPKDIQALQKCLAGLNLYSGEASGIVNQETRDAVTELSKTAKNNKTGERLITSNEINSTASQACLVTIIQEKMAGMGGGNSGGTLYFTSNGIRTPLRWKNTYGMMSWTIRLQDRRKLPQSFSIPRVTYVCNNGSSYNKKLGSFSTALKRGVIEYLDSKACKGKKGVKTARLAN